jgi:hypothetical protein
MDDTNQTSQKNEPASTRTTIDTTSTCGKQCLPPTNYCKINGIHLNATIGSLPVKTLCNAIDNDWLTSFPGLTSSAIRKQLPKSISTTMGHMHMIRKGIRSTKPTVNEIMNEEINLEPTLDPPHHINNNREHYVGVTMIAFEELKGRISNRSTRKISNNIWPGKCLFHGDV